MRFTVVLCLYGLVSIGLAHFQPGKSCLRFLPKNRCDKSTAPLDCNTKETGLTCMGVRVGYSGATFNFCSYPLWQSCFCDAELTSAETCEAGLSCQAICLHKWDFIKRPFCKYQCLPNPLTEHLAGGSCEWSRIFENNANGVPATGMDIGNLATAVVAGARVKVYTPKFGMLTVEKVTVHVNEDGQLNVYAQELTSSAPPGVMVNYLVMSTEGNVHMSMFNVEATSPGRRDNVNFGSDMIWFVRDCYTQVDDEMTLSRAIQDGASVRVVLDAESSLELDALTYTPVHGDSVWEMRDILHGREFNVTEQWVFRHITFNGNMTTTSYKVHQHDIQMHEETVPEVTWHVEAGWRAIYRHNSAGESEFRELDNLISAVESSQRVKIRIDGILFEAGVVKVCGDVVMAYVFDSINYDSRDVTWCWLIVSSTGTVRVLETPYGENNFTETVTSKDVTWFVDTREWKEAYSTDVNSNVTEDTADLILAVEAGVDIRYMVQLEGCHIYYDAEQVRIVSTEVEVYNNREVTLAGNQYVRRYNFLDTSGVYTTADFLPESPELVTSTSQQMNATTWFTAA